MNSQTIILFIAALLPLCLGWMLDFLLGDPECLPHPIVWFGRMISFGERRMNRGKHRKIKGALWASFCVLVVFIITNACLWLPFILIDSKQSFIPYYIYIAVGTICIFFCLAGHTLRKEVKMVFEASERSLEDGRKQVARIVGRDTSALSKQEVRTAALETLAENLSDGVIAPLFWLFILGVPGMMTYKMINTLDSMIGYKTERYKDFGAFAAHLDDFANYVPARLTAFLMAILTTSEMRSSRNLGQRLRFISQFGPQHASPNSGWPEAALAAMLDCRFGGPHNYFGQYFHKPFIGRNNRKLTTNDMRKSIRLALYVEMFYTIATLTALVAITYFSLN